MLYHSYFLFSLCSNKAVKIYIHLMSLILPFFFHGLLSSCVKRSLVNLKSIADTFCSTDLFLFAFSISVLSLLGGNLPLCLSQPPSRMHTVQHLSNICSLQSMFKARLNPSRKSAIINLSRLCYNCHCSLRGTNVSVVDCELWYMLGSLGEKVSADYCDVVWRNMSLVCLGSSHGSTQATLL